MVFIKYFLTCLKCYTQLRKEKYLSETHRDLSPQTVLSCAVTLCAPVTTEIIEEKVNSKYPS